ncbi:MAG: aminoacyl-tRNA hydrolase [Acidobacteriota bacterium]|nr:aminoacyl-tRNA hydrolase [Blastocatellia bacterium]MDW8413683.1 aminoacyl-tRNA hydrolase [Acidobacteriota bacterium]
MKLIVGLGNPGRRYERSRHNLGFMLLDRLVVLATGQFDCKECEALVHKGSIAGTTAIFAKPQTFMNLSGQSVACLLNKYYVDAKTDLLVISDDVALPLGRIRIRAKGSAGGHNGLKSIISFTGQEFARLRLGIKPEFDVVDLAEFVLENFTVTEQPLVDRMLERATEVVQTWLSCGIEKAAATASRSD